jgi:carbamoyl-phosphate synthase large subunit
MMKRDEIAFVVNIPTKGKDIRRAGFKLRTLAERLKVPCFTCYDTVGAYMMAMEAYIEEEPLTYEPIAYYC